MQSVCKGSNNVSSNIIYSLFEIQGKETKAQIILLTN